MSFSAVIMRSWHCSAPAAAVLAAAVLLPGGLAASTRATLPQQSSYASERVAGLVWQGTPAALTPTNFTIMFPDGITPAAADRVEIHLPGFGGAYNSFGAPATTTVLSGSFLPAQNGIKVYSRVYRASVKQTIWEANLDDANERFTWTNHGLSAGDPVRFYAGGGTAATPLVDGTVYYVHTIVDANTFTLTTSVGGNQIDITNDGNNNQFLVSGTESAVADCLDAAEWDPKREVLKILVDVDGKCGRDNIDGVTIDEGYLRQLYQRDGLPSGKVPTCATATTTKP